MLADTWVNADVPEARADLLHAIYDRIVVKGRSIVAARLTPAAYSNGLALALPQVVMARPEGIRTPDRLIRSQMLCPLSYGRAGVHRSAGRAGGLMRR